MNKKKILPVILPAIFITGLFIILGITIGDNFLAVHDSPILLTQTEIDKGILYFWNENNFGTSYYLVPIAGLFPRVFSLIFLTLGLSTKWMYMLFYISLCNLIFYSSWFAFNKIIQLLQYKRSFFGSFIGAFFYSFNLYTITFWHGGNIDATFVVFSIAPILLYILISILVSGLTLQKALFIILCIFLTVNTGPYAFAVFISLLFPALLIGVSKNSLNKKLPLLAIFIFLTLLLSQVFLIPLGMQIFRGDIYATSDGLRSYAFSDNGIRGIFRLFFEWTIDEFWSGRYFHSYYPFYASIASIISIFVIWVASLSSMVTLRDKFKNIQFFLVTILLISIFLAKATQAPFGVINEFLYKYVPLFGMFRTPDTKFGLPVVLILSLLLSFSFTTIYSKPLKVLLITCVLLQTWIFFTMLPILEVKKGESYQRIIKIPDEYIKVAGIVNSDKNYGRVLFYPGLSYANYNYDNGYGLTGQDILGKMIDRPAVYADGFIMKKAEEKYAELTKSFDPKVLGHASVKYVYIRNEINKINSSSTVASISAKQNMNLVYASKIGTLYKIPDTFLQPYIKVMSENKEYKNIKVEKLNPTRYRVILPSLSNNKVSLLFNSSFHPDWILKSDREIQIIDHSLYNGFGNRWDFKVNGDRNEEVVLDLYFWPQNIFYLSMGLTAATLASIVLLFYGIFKKTKE